MLPPLRFRPHLHVQQLDFPMEMAPLYFQFFSRTGNVPMMLTQLSRDILFLECVTSIPERVIRLRKEWIGRGSESRSLRCRPDRPRLQREACLRRRRREHFDTGQVVREHAHHAFAIERVVVDDHELGQAANPRSFERLPLRAMPFSSIDVVLSLHYVT